jgi:ribonuclease HI
MKERPTPPSRVRVLEGGQIPGRSPAQARQAGHDDTPGTPVGLSKVALILYCDGLCEPSNPGGFACWAWVAYAERRRIAFNYGCLGHGPAMTNNVAEYHAVLQALRWLQSKRVCQAVLYTDSRLVAEQATGRWRVRSAHLLPLATHTQVLLAATQTSLRWVPREANAPADALTRVAYTEAQRGQPGLKGR